MPSDARKFRFVSPGIFINEIDQSQIPAIPDAVGPVVIGRAPKGPGMTPIKVGSFSEFAERFGNPLSGLGTDGDVWRLGNGYAAPSYGAYAAQAYLRAGIGPVTFIRLMGTQSPDATSAGKAGWITTKTGPTSNFGTNGGAYGLFVFESGSAINATNKGTLAAIWYLNEGGIVLSGTLAGGAATTASAGGVVTATDGEYKAQIFNASNTKVEDITFNLTEGSRHFIRNVFNTNPENAGAIADTNSSKTYWLGQSYESYVSRAGTDAAALNSTTGFGVILAVANGATDNGPHEQRIPYRDAHSGWFFAQNLNADTASYTEEAQQKLFKFVGINGHGAWLHRNIKISINNIKAPSNDNVKFGTFDVEIRKAQDTDLGPVILERFSNCNLDPRSANYIARKIGDISVEFDNDEKRYREFGDYPNSSEYVRVVVHDDVGTIDPKILPFGVFGPPKYPDWTATAATSPTNGNASTNAFALGSNEVAYPRCTAGTFMSGTTAIIAGAPLGTNFGTASIAYPDVLTRLSCSSGADGADPTTNAYFGLQTNKSRTSTVFDNGYVDYLRPLGADVVSDAVWVDDFGINGYTSPLVPQFKFTLDEVVVTYDTSTYSATTPTLGIQDAAYVSGSLIDGGSFNASGSTGGTANFENILNAKINRFTSPLFGGFDGVDITERDPFRNTLIDGTSPTEETNYVFFSLRRAINTVADAEVVEMNLATIPGIWHEETTKYLIDTCEARGDALAIVDLKGGFLPRHESTSSKSTRKGQLGDVLTNIKARNLNSSYGAAYYPWVKVRDDQSGTIVTMPPSVVALGVLANTERAADVWFAPAGFRRGGLSLGAAGLTVAGVETKLTSRNRDDLYEVNVNPIASFPAEGVVVFGQKTLQATQSALDRINVRRLLIFLKRGISRISSTTLFQPNVQATWNNFKSRADQFLGDVQTRFGLDDFRVVLDETTTTPDLVDRNILYAKIFVKPTRAIEFIAIDFIITRSGASFDD
jgi:hypothetical protein